MRDVEIQRETTKIKADSKVEIANKMIELEKLRHKNIMKEIAAMMVANITHLSRDKIYIGDKKKK